MRFCPKTLVLSLMLFPFASYGQSQKEEDIRFIDGQIIIPFKEIENGAEKVNRARSLPPVVHSLPQAVPYPVLSSEDGNDFANYLVDQIKEYQLPGFAFAIVQERTIVVQKAIGKLNIKAEADINAETLFNVGPATHALTSLLAATLATENSTLYDKSARKIDTLFRLSDPSTQKSVTLRHLLNMTAGLPNYVDTILDPTWSRPEDVFEVIAQSPITAKPGQAFNYSKVSVASAGYLISKRHHQAGNVHEAYTTAVRERLFIPMEMEQATFSVEAAKATGNYASPHKLDKGNYRPVAHWEPTINTFAPAIGLKANLNDMIQWLSTELNQGTTPSGNILAPAHAVTERWQPFQGKKEQQHGMGWTRQVYLKTEIIGNTGSYDRHTCGIGLLPEYRTGFVVLINASGPDAAKLVQEVALGLTEMMVEASSGKQ